ncbi:MAG: alpha/beta hydrolase fold protein [Caulobacteraceae bacterium]|nr:alpha/beta hydrolase fold protein [Caulobacteraceae bacterium]
MTDPRRFTLQLADGEMAGLDFGDLARPVDAVFLHATGFNASTYRQSLGLAGQRLRVIALDQRGHGLSSLPADSDGLRDWRPFAEDLSQALDALKLDRPVVLSGHSMGGTVSVLAAAHLGARVRGLVLVDPVIMRAPAGQGVSDSPLVIGARRRRPAFASKADAVRAYLGRGAFRTWPPEAVADYVEDGFRDAADGVALTCAPAWEAGIFSVSVGYDPRLALDAIAAPIAILRAEHGSTCDIDPEIHVARFPDRSLVTVPGSSHFLPMERPDLVAQALLAACA